MLNRIDKFSLAPEPQGLPPEWFVSDDIRRDRINRLFLGGTAFHSPDQIAGGAGKVTKKAAAMEEVDLENVDLTNIYRVDHAKANGWQVRMSRQGTTHNKFFSVKRFGGVKEALEAAVCYRDKLRKLAPRESPSAKSVRMGRNDGIQYSERLQCWIAQWMELGKRKTRKFSVKKHGKLRAEQMARDARMRGVAGLAD